MRRFLTKTINSTLADAVAAGCDCVQPKLNGRFCRIVADGTTVSALYRDEGEVLYTGDANGADCTLLADYFGPPWGQTNYEIVVWDCVGVGDDPLLEYEYRHRYAFAAHFVKLLGSPFVTVPNFPITHAALLWNSLGPNTCGLVYRKSTVANDDPVRVARKYKEMPGGLP